MREVVRSAIHITEHWLHSLPKAWLAAALLAIHAALLAYGAYVHSYTLNEPGHLAAGISHWQFGDFRMYRVNPPLVRMIAALPVLAAGVETDWTAFYDGPGARPEFPVGADFVAANGYRAFWLLTLARWACIPFSLLGAVVAWRWAGALYGQGAGLLGLTLWCFCPNMIAHGQLITADMAAASLGLAACYTFWRWLQSPTWMHTLLSGAVLGVAELAKTTLIVLYPLWFVLWLIYRWPARASLGLRGWLRELGMLLARTLVALYVINVGYGFSGALKPLGEFQFVSQSLTGKEERGGAGNRFAGTWLAAVPVPLPQDYVFGIDLQRKDFEHFGQQSYLRGEFRDTGWWYYYLYALGVKVPVGTWLLAGLVLGCRLFRVLPGAAWRDELILLLPAAVIFVLVSSQTGLNQHMRYVLPIFPPAFVWLSQAGGLFKRSLPRSSSASSSYSSLKPQASSLKPAALAALAIAWSIMSSLLVYPHSLSYFNELAGGPQNGHRHLLHSNLDWGQDLLFLKRWLDDHPEARPLYLAYHSGYSAAAAGIEFELPPQALGPRAEGDSAPAGWYALSANFVYGTDGGTYRQNHERGHVAPCRLAAFRGMRPAARIGHSIIVFRVEIGTAAAEKK